jgi:DNA-binding NarL/FixJ family response regulator
MVEASITMSNLASKSSQPEQLTKGSERLSPAAAGPPNVAEASTIAIIDTHRFSRECLLRVLSDDSNAAVSAFSSIDQWFNDPQRASTVLIILCQYGRSHEEALAEVHRLTELSSQVGTCAIVVLSNNEDPDLIVKMLGKSVRGYVPTSLSIPIVVQAIELARAGGVYVPASSLFAAHQRAPEEPTAQAKPTNSIFTARQAAVVDALRRGKANKIIAYELKMRESTVKVHVRNIMKKLHATNRTEVAYMANRLLNGEELAG